MRPLQQKIIETLKVQPKIDVQQEIGRTIEFLKEYLVERKGTYSLKWDALDKRFGNANLTSMWVADMEIKAPKEVIEALKERCEHGVFGYSYVSDEYYNSVINWLKEKHNYEIKKEWLRFI